MTALDDLMAARDLRSMQDRRTRAIVDAAVPRIVRARVTEVFDGESGRGGTATVVRGQVESPGVRWHGHRPRIHDLVLVELPPAGGTRRIVAIDRELDEPPQPDLPRVVLWATGGDDAAAFRAAIEAASPGTTFILPSPYYVFSTVDADGRCVSIRKDHIRFVGRGGDTVDNGTPNWTGGSTTAIRCTVSGATMFHWGPKVDNSDAPTGSQADTTWGGGMTGITVGGNGGTAAVGVHIAGGVFQMRFKDCWFGIASVAAVLGGRVEDNNIVAAGHNHSDAIIRFDDCNFRAQNAADCVLLDGMLNGGVGGGHSYHWVFFNCTLIYATGAGLHLLNADDVFLFGCNISTVDQTTGFGIVHEGSTDGSYSDGVVTVACYGTGLRQLYKGAGLNRPGIGGLMLGQGLTDAWTRSAWETAGRGYYVDTRGRHNLRFDASTAAEILDEFIGGQASDGTFADGRIGDRGWAKTHASTTVVRADAERHHPGIIAIGTGGTTDTPTGIILGDDSAGMLSPLETFDSYFVFRLPVVDSAVVARVGWIRSIGAIPAHGIYLEKLSGDTSWWCVTRAGGTQTRTSLGYNVNAGEWVCLSIWLRYDGGIGFATRIDISSGSTNLAKVTNTTNIPAVSLSPAYLIQSATGSDRSMEIDHFTGQWHGLYRRQGVQNDIKTVTIGGAPSGGTFTLTFGGRTTGAITWSSDNATLLANVDAALEALVNVGSSQVTCTAGTLSSGVGTFTIEFTGGLVRQRRQPEMTATSSLSGTGATVSVATTTVGY